MKLRNKLQRNSFHAAVFAATLVSTTVLPIINQHLTIAQAAPVPAKSADSFVDSIGVNTHLTYGGTPYQRFDDLIIPKLQEANIRHIRDGGYNDPDFFNKIKKLSSLGIKSNIIFSGNSMDEVLSIIRSMSGAIASVEGPNESDLEFFNFSYNGQKFPEGTRNYQRDLYNTIKGNSDTKHLSVVLPSMGWGENAGKMGYIGDYGDFCNMHNYPNIGQPPTIDLDSYFIPHANTMCGEGKIKWSTETGYHNETSHDMGISEEAGGKYIPRLLLESFNRNIKRTFLYEFVNQSSNSGDQDNYGLLYNDGSNKPAFTAIKNMTTLLKEPGANFGPGSLDYTLSGNTDDIHSTLLQKSKGEFYLILWQEVRSWDNDNKKEIPVGNREIKVNLATNISRAEVYVPKDSGSPTLTQDAPSGGRLSDLTVSVPDHPLIIKLVPNGVSSSGSNNGGSSNGGSSTGGSSNGGSSTGGSNSGGSSNGGSSTGGSNSGGSESKPVVTAYQHSNFGGTSQTFSTGVYAANKGNFNIVGNDQISSLRVPQGYVAKVCENETQQGVCRTYEAGDHTSVGSDLNDKISYMEISAVSSEVKVYQHSNFGGTSQSFSMGEYAARDGKFNIVGNDQISSLRVPQGLVAYVCENESQQGVCRTYEAGDHSSVGSDLNDKISYMEILKAD